MPTRQTSGGVINGSCQEGRKASWMARLAARLELSVYDLWVIILTIATMGVLYLVGEVAARLSGI